MCKPSCRLPFRRRKNIMRCWPLLRKSGLVTRGLCFFRTVIVCAGLGHCAPPGRLRPLHCVVGGQEFGGLWELRAAARASENGALLTAPHPFCCLPFPGCARGPSPRCRAFARPRSRPRSHIQGPEPRSRPQGLLFCGCVSKRYQAARLAVAGPGAAAAVPSLPPTRLHSATPTGADPAPIPVPPPPRRSPVFRDRLECPPVQQNRGQRGGCGPAAVLRPPRSAAPAPHHHPHPGLPATRTYPPCPAQNWRPVRPVSWCINAALNIRHHSTNRKSSYGAVAGIEPVMEQCTSESRRSDDNGTLTDPSLEVLNFAQKCWRPWERPEVALSIDLNVASSSINQNWSHLTGQQEFLPLYEC